MSRVLAMLVVLILSMEQANAVSLGKNGRGQVLLFPFVTAQNGWDTYLGLNLSLFGGQIVKLRFLDARDGELVQSFNIYSQQGFNWRAAVFESQDGPVLRIGEGNCTISDRGTFGGAGTDFELDASLFMVEAYLVSMTLDNDFRESTCEEIAARWGAQGEWVTDDPNIGLEQREEPETTIVGYFDLVNVVSGLSGSQPATALRDVLEDVPHTSPASEQPNLSMADPVAVAPNGEVVTYEEWDGIDAIAWIMTNGGDGSVITNDVITNDGIRASTDWVVAKPLAGYRTDLANTVISGEELFCESTGIDASGPESVRVEVSNPWGVSGGGDNVGLYYTPFSPAIYQSYQPFLCYSVNVVSFGNNDAIFLAEDADNQYRFTDLNGISMSDTSRTVDYAFLYRDRARIAFRATTFVNGQIEWISSSPPVYSIANYMTLRAHVLR